MKSHAKFEQKLTCGLANDMRNLANFNRNTWNVKIGTFMGSFYLKWKMHELKIYREVLCNDTEEWWKIWRGIDLLLQNLHDEFDKLWLEHWKVSKIYILMGCFWQKYKKYRGVMFDSTEDWCKIWRKTDFYFPKWHEKFGKFSSTGWKIAISL